ncbi:MAG: hypothetical protein KGK10_04475 [Rhodospirillales bacterium]|nr:hypothetical protein [Rhodospirillales bacterium]
MIDNTSLVISLFFVGLFLLRAVVLDRRLPWFKPIRPEDVRAALRRRIGPSQTNDRF